jgi:serine protease
MTARAREKLVGRRPVLLVRPLLAAVLPRPLRLPVVATAAALAAAAPAAPAAAAPAPARAVLAGFDAGASRAQIAQALRAAGLRGAEPIGPGQRRAIPGRGTGLAAALAALRRDDRVAWASVDRPARSTDYVPNDSGVARKAGPAGGWQSAAWNLAGPFGVRAPLAWDLARLSGMPGGRGIRVAVLDTGVAYADRPPYRRSPDLPRGRILRGYDFVARDRYPNDANGHGTFVATTIAGAADNAYGMPGLAYAADVIPVRVLNAEGEGMSSRIAEGIRYAVGRGARVLNVSIELFDPFYLQAQSITAAPEIRSALRYAASRGAVVVAAAGNRASAAVPSRTLATHIVYVGGSTEHGCLGGYSNYGPGLDLVAPGGGGDRRVPGDPDCRRTRTPGRNIAQVTFRRRAPGRFVVPAGYKGTSMAAPHVTAAVALLLGARTLGSQPAPAAVEARLARTARDLGPAGTDRWFGAGLLDAAAALGAPPQAPG